MTNTQTLLYLMHQNRRRRVLDTMEVYGAKNQTRAVTRDIWRALKDNLETDRYIEQLLFN